MDEGLGAGDTSFYEKAQERMTRFCIRQEPCCSHLIPMNCCDVFVIIGVVFNSGRIVFSGPLEAALEFYHCNHGSVSVAYDQ